MVKGDTLLIEVGGSLRRIKLSDLANSICTNQLDLSLIAWGTYLKETNDTQWGVCGNQTKWNEFKSSLGRYLLTNDGRMAKLSRSNSAVLRMVQPLTRLRVISCSTPLIVSTIL